MKKMKRFLVALLSCLTAVACVAGISACKDDKKTASNDSSSSAEKPSYDINVVIPGLEGCAHEYGVVYTIPATCTETGANYIACLKCGKNDLMINSEVIPELGHKWVVTEAKEATCTEDGNGEFKTCEVCGKVDGDNTVIKATGHTMKNAFPTIVTDPGDYDGDGDEDADDFVAMTEGYEINDQGYCYISESCNSRGVDPFKYCTTCFENFIATIVDENGDIIEDAFLALMDRIGEEPDDAKIVEVLFENVYTEGLNFRPADHVALVDYITSTGTVDGKFGPDDIATVNDKLFVKASDADCTINGVKNFKICSACLADKGEDVEVAAEAPVLEVIAAYKKAGIYVGEYKEVVSTAHTDEKEDHTSTFVAGKAATCTEAGYEWYYTCTKCGEKVNTVNGVAKVIPALGHTPNGTEEDVTCEAGIKCTVCDAELQKPAAHKLVSVANKAATCTEAGWTNKKYCENCDYTTETIVPAKQHSWTKKVTAAMFTSCKTGEFKDSTLLENGTYYICANDKCGMWAQYFAAEGDTPAYYGDAQEASLYIEFNHTPSDSYAPATCAADAKNYKCTVCSVNFEHNDEPLTKAEYIKVNGHDMGSNAEGVASYEATCAAAGKCYTCNATLAKLDHKLNGESTWVEVAGYEEEVAATCTAGGHYKAEECTQCHIYRVWQNGKWVTEYTLANGVKVPVSTADFDIEAGAHEYKEVAGKMATCKEDGYTAHKVCTICGEKEGYTVLDADAVPCAAEHPEASCRVVCNHSYIAKWNDVNKNGICDPEEMDDNVVWAGCGEIIEGTGDCVYGENHVCKVCGVATTPAHDYDDGKCTICGKKED